MEERKVKSSVIRTTFKIIFLISILGFYYAASTSNFINNNLIKNNPVVNQEIINKINYKYNNSINSVLIDSIVQDKNKSEIQTSNVKDIDHTTKIYNSNTNINDNNGSDNAANLNNNQLNDKNQTDSAADDTQQNSQNETSSTTNPENDAGNNSNNNENNANNFTLQLLNLINSVRLSNGLCQLNQNQALNPVAQSRSSDMINRDYFSHTTPDGKNINNILQDYGIMYAAAGENIIFASPPSYASPEYFFNTWMNSDTHRANILSSLFTQIGIGIDANSDRLVAVLVFIS